MQSKVAVPPDALNARHGDYAERASWFVAFILLPLLTGLASVLLGKDINWDLLNYHYYNAHAFLTGRMGFDIAPAQWQTFFNPILDLPFYWMTQHLASRSVGFVIGLVHGFNLSLVLLIFLKVINRPLRTPVLLAGVCLVAFSAIAPGFISELGNTMNDNLTSLFVLAPLFLLVPSARRLRRHSATTSTWVVGAAGLIVGIGVGLKPTIAAMALGMAIAVMFLASSWRLRLRDVALFAAAASAGALLSAGWWWYILWSRYGNPVLPYLNDLFQSPYLPAIGYFDARYIPRSPWEYLVWPLLFSLDSYRVNPLRFVDIRFALFYIAGVVWLLTEIGRRITGPGGDAASRPHSPLILPASGNFLLVFFLGSFVGWMVLSSNYRFLIPLELLLPLCFVILVQRRLDGAPRVIGVASLAIILTFAVFRPFNWTRLQWSDPYLRVDTSAVDASTSALVIMLGSAPTSYVVPDFPASYRFVRPEGNLASAEDHGLLRDVRALIQNGSSALYVLYEARDPTVDLARTSSWLGIHIDANACVQLPVNTLDQLLMCRAARQSPPDLP